MPPFLKIMEPRQRIIEHTVELISKQGYEGTSVRDIASAAGVNVAMIKYYFGGKEQLLEEVLENKLSYLRNIFIGLVKNQDMTAIEKIDRIIDLLIERKFSSRNFHHLLHRELSLEKRPQLKDRVSDLLMLNVSPVKKILKDGIKSGEFKKVDAEMTVATVVGTVHYLLINDTMCQKILDKKKDFSPFNNKQLKRRLSNHVKQLIRSHLLQ